MKKIIDGIKKAKKIIEPMKDPLQDSQSKHADSVIRSHVLWSMGAGAFIPLPFLDSVGVAAVQLDMVRQLGKIYNIEFEDTKYKAIVSSIMGTFLARAGAKSLVKLIPFAGTYIGAAAMGILAGASSYTLGELFKSHFENGGTLLDIDVDRMKRQFAERFEKNKEVVKKIREDHEKMRSEGKMEGGFSVNDNSEADETPAAETPPPAEAPVEEEKPLSIVDELQKLGELLENGVISEKEFKVLKKKLIQKFSS